jgi:hypothetical protein
LAEVLSKTGAVEAQKAFSHVPICKVDELASADAVIFGTKREMEDRIKYGKNIGSFGGSS